MENKKIVKILAKDMSELEELIFEMKKRKQFNALEMNFIHTRAKGVLQLLQLLETSEEPVTLQQANEVNLINTLEDKTEDVSKPEAGISPAQQVHENKEENPDKKLLPGVIPEPGGKDEEDGAEGENEPGLPEAAVAKNEGYILGEEAPKPEGTSRLGDSFLKGKSVNDVINEQVKLEYKLSNRPVSSIQTAIGINDRFQYIRELFDGDSKKFSQAVQSLDSMNNIREATEYLRSNFKWNKNETSLKFVNLVKRRFQPDSGRN